VEPDLVTLGAAVHSCARGNRPRKAEEMSGQPRRTAEAAGVGDCWRCELMKLLEDVNGRCWKW
jgi:hypothetical protein